MGWMGGQMERNVGTGLMDQSFDGLMTSFDGYIDGSLAIQ
jgi:hypothetical protein